jgi:hypothetical protein
MPRSARADDDFLSLPARFHGPGGRLPPARYSAWGFGLLLFPVGVYLTTSLGPFSFLPNLGLGLVVAVVVAIVATKAVFTHVTFYRPLRGWRKALRCEVTAPRPVTQRWHRTRPLAPMKIRRHP